MPSHCKVLVLVPIFPSSTKDQVRKLYCVSRAVPNLPINLEDAARSEVEIEKALQVLFFLLKALKLHVILSLGFMWECAFLHLIGGKHPDQFQKGHVHVVRG